LQGQPYRGGLYVPPEVQQRAWIAHLALLVALFLIALLIVWLRRPETLQRTEWAFPIRRRWLRLAARAVLAVLIVFSVVMTMTGGLWFFLLFPGASRW
jgi:hypothetical protein